MPALAELTTLAESALVLSIVISLPVIGVAAIVGLVVAALQAVTQLQDSTIAHLPRLLAVAIVLAVTGPWMGSELASFALAAFSVR
jgi:type III secretion HrpO family protein